MLGKEFTYTREFDASRDIVFKAFTEPEQLKQWWGPKGFNMVSCTIELKPNGVFHYCVQAPNGSEMWGKWVFREISAPEKLSFVNSFSDKDGNITRHPMAPTWPQEVLNHLTFTEQDGKTTIAMRGAPINASEEEHQLYESGFASMQAGFDGTMNQLDAYLEAFFSRKG